MVGAEGRCFDSTSSRHVGTLGKSFTCNCLYDVMWRPVATLRLKFDSCNSLLSSAHTLLICGVSDCVLNKNVIIIIPVHLYSISFRCLLRTIEDTPCQRGIKHESASADALSSNSRRRDFCLNCVPLKVS